MSESVRFGFYLRPSLAMCRAQAEIHDLLERQYGLRAAGRFMPHATIKGFFRSDAPPEEMVTRLNRVLDGRVAFPVHNLGVVPFPASAIVLNIHHLPDGGRNQPLQALHEAAVAALKPLVDPRCTFSAREWIGDRFVAHLTLAMADIPERHFEEILQFILEAEPIGPESFTAEVYNLWEFRSDDWDGPWWESLTWRLLHSWQLVKPAGT